MAGLILGQAVIGGNEAMFAILLKSVIAGEAALTAIYHATDTNRIADLEPSDLAADCAHMADDLMTGNARVERSAPFGANLMKIGMADPAIGDVDLDIEGTGLTPPDVDRLQRLVAGIGTKSFRDHKEDSCSEGSNGDHCPYPTPPT